MKIDSLNGIVIILRKISTRSRFFRAPVISFTTIFPFLIWKRFFHCFETFVKMTNCECIPIILKPLHLVPVTQLCDNLHFNGAIFHHQFSYSSHRAFFYYFRGRVSTKNMSLGETNDKLVNGWAVSLDYSGVCLSVLKVSCMHKKRWILLPNRQNKQNM